MKAILTSLCLIFCLAAAAQEVELNKTDITTLSNFDGNKASFFGLKKGMTKAEAVKTLNALRQFTWKYDQWNTKSEDVNSLTETRIYVSLAEKSGDDDPTVMYLLWDNNKKGMTGLVIYEAAIPYVIGNTQKLFTTEAISGEATFNGFLKTKPVIIDETYTMSYSYPAQHFAFTSYKDLDGKIKVWINFSDK